MAAQRRGQKKGRPPDPWAGGRVRKCALRENDIGAGPAAGRLPAWFCRLPRGANDRNHNPASAPNTPVIDHEIA
jgi:hypothetical protein